MRILIVLFALLANVSITNGESLPKQDSAPGSESSYVIEGYWLLSIVELDKSANLKLTDADREFTNAFGKNLLAEELRIETSASLKKLGVDTGNDWLKFNLIIDGRRRRLKLSSLEGKLVRDVCFDGKNEVQYFVDSGQANVFSGKSHVHVPDWNSFFPISRALSTSDHWVKRSGRIFVHDSETHPGVSFEAECDDSGFVRRLSTNYENRTLKQSTATNWVAITGDFFQPVGTAEFSLNGDLIRSIDFYLVSSASKVEVSEKDFVVTAPAGTNVFEGGLGAPGVIGKKLSTGKKLSVESADLSQELGGK